MTKRMVSLVGLVVLIVAYVMMPVDAVWAASPARITAAPASGGPIGYSFTVVGASNEQVQASVAYNSQDEEYLVVYQNEWNSGADKNIAAARVSKTGEVLSIFNIEPTSPTHSPDVAYNLKENTYLVVWQDDTSWPSVRGAVVSATGSVTKFDIAIGSNIFDYSVPAVAYASTEDNYLVVWQEHSPVIPITYEIWGRLISSTGVPDGGSFEISGQTPTESDYRKSPDVAYCRTRNEHLVVWEQRDVPTNQYDIHARRVTAGGQPLQPDSLNISTLGHTERAAAVAANPITNGEGDYLVAWELEFADDNNIGVYAKTVHFDTNGAVTLGLLKIFNGSADETNPAVAANESNHHYLLTWTEAGYALPFNFIGIMGREMSSEGTRLGDENTAISGNYADNSALAGGPLGDFLIAFDDQVIAAPDHDLYGNLWGNRVYLPLVLRQ